MRIKMESLFVSTYGNVCFVRRIFHPEDAGGWDGRNGCPAYAIVVSGRYLFHPSLLYPWKFTLFLRDRIDQSANIRA